MHALEKILAAHAGVESVTTGEIVNCKVDVAGINDLYLQVVYSFFEMGGTQVANPEGTVVFLDHYAPASSAKQAQNQKEFRAFCKEQHIPHLMDVNTGVCHQILADKGFSAPGRLMVVTDSHTTTHGAFGAFSTGVGATDLSTILLTGELWFRVPEIIRINLEGTLPAGVFAKDVILHVIGDLGADYAVYQGVEFAGSLIAQLSVAERMTLCNMTTEMGAKAAYIVPDAITMAHLDSVRATDYTVYETDNDFVYHAEHTYDVSHLMPQLSAPSSVDNVCDITAHVGTAVDQCFIGTCTGGRIEDLAVAAKILQGKHIAPTTRLLIVPASQKVLLDAIALGYMATLVEAGATFVTPGCAACLGTHEGILAEGEVCITASNRNFPGRMGHNKAKIFLASPATVAASALAGVIVNPMEDCV